MIYLLSSFDVNKFSFFKEAQKAGEAVTHSCGELAIENRDQFMTAYKAINVVQAIGRHDGMMPWFGFYVEPMDVFVHIDDVYGEVANNKEAHLGQAIRKLAVSQDKQLRLVERVRFSLEGSEDTYKSVVISTGHLSPKDKEGLSALAVNTDLVLERETGFFVKLGEEWDDFNEHVFKNKLQPMVGDDYDQLPLILEAAHQAGYRMVEFDEAGATYDLTVYDDDGGVERHMDDDGEPSGGTKFRKIEWGAGEGVSVELAEVKPDDSERIKEENSSAFIAAVEAADHIESLNLPGFERTTNAAFYGEATVSTYAAWPMFLLPGTTRSNEGFIESAETLDFIPSADDLEIQLNGNDESNVTKVLPEYCMNLTVVLQTIESMTAEEYGLIDSRLFYVLEALDRYDNHAGMVAVTNSKTGEIDNFEWPELMIDHKLFKFIPHGEDLVTIQGYINEGGYPSVTKVKVECERDVELVVQAMLHGVNFEN